MPMSPLLRREVFVILRTPIKLNSKSDVLGILKINRKISSFERGGETLLPTSRNSLYVWCRDRFYTGAKFGNEDSGHRKLKSFR